MTANQSMIHKDSQSNSLGSPCIQRRPRKWIKLRPHMCCMGFILGNYNKYVCQLLPSHRGRYVLPMRERGHCAYAHTPHAALWCSSSLPPSVFPPSLLLNWYLPASRGTLRKKRLLFRSAGRSSRWEDEATLMLGLVNFASIVHSFVNVAQEGKKWAISQLGTITSNPRDDDGTVPYRVFYGVFSSQGEI